MGRREVGSIFSDCILHHLLIVYSPILFTSDNGVVMPRTDELAEAIFKMSMRMWRRAAKAISDLTESEFLALDCLASKSGTVGEVITSVQVLPAQMSRIVKRLEQAGYVTSDLNPDDKRKVDLSITSKGKKAHQQFRKAKIAPIVEALGRLTPVERESFMSLVRRMFGN